MQMIVRGLLLAVQLGVLGLGGFAFWTGPLQAPFFSTQAWYAAPIAEGVPVPLRMQFDPESYHVTQGWALLASLRGADPETRREGGEALVAHARLALEAAPASGYAWLVLAWGEYLAGREGSAREALQASWRWAPESRTLSWARVLLASRWWNDLGPESRGRILGEMYRGRSQDPDGFQRQLDQDPAFAELWRRAGTYVRRQRSLDPG